MQCDFPMRCGKSKRKFFQPYFYASCETKLCLSIQCLYQMQNPLKWANRFIYGRKFYWRRLHINWKHLDIVHIDRIFLICWYRNESIQRIFIWNIKDIGNMDVCCGVPPPLHLFFIQIVESKTDTDENRLEPNDEMHLLDLKNYVQ